jgi:hypothetical protein
VPILTACCARQPCKSRPGRRSSVPQRTKFGQSELQSSSARRTEQRRFARGTDAGTQQRTSRILRLASVLAMQVGKRPLCEPILSRVPSDDRTAACLTFNVCLHRRPSSNTVSAQNLAWALRQAAPLTGRGKQPIVHRRRISSCARQRELVVTRLPAAAKSIVSDRTSSARRSPIMRRAMVSSASR